MADQAPPSVPLPTLLSPALVAFTIEFDNEFEHQMTHRTASTPRGAGPRGAPWLVSQVMWSNVMQFVEPDGVTIQELHARARTNQDSLSGLQRWHYVVVDSVAGRLTSGRRPDMVVRPTPAGRQAQEIWRPLGGLIEGRWRDRFSATHIDEIRRALRGILERIETPLPNYVPIIHPAQGGRAEIPPPGTPDDSAPDDPASVDISVLLARVLLAFTLDFERESKVSLAVSATTLRVLSESDVRVRDLPRLTGVSKEAIAMCVGFLERHAMAEVAPDPLTGRGNVVRLTAKGLGAQKKYRRVLGHTEADWRTRFGSGQVDRLRQALEPLVGDGATLATSRLSEGMTPYPDGWRAKVRPPEILPHYPMVLHRGGYPDGA